MRFTWPHGKPCAVVVSFDVDAESAYAQVNPQHTARLLGAIAERRHGPRVAIPRILRLLDELGIKGRCYVPGYTPVHHLDAVRSIQAEGHELGCHGNNHEALEALDEASDVAVLGNSSASSTSSWVSGRSATAPRTGSSTRARLRS